MSKKTVVRNRFSQRISVQLKCPEIGMTKQEFKKSCDANEIMRRYTRTGVLPEEKRRKLYGDFSESVDYQEACNIVIQAEEQFMSLPSELRKKLDNDPAKFLNYVHDEANIDELREYGIFEPDFTKIVEDASPGAAPGGTETSEISEET